MNMFEQMAQIATLVQRGVPVYILNDPSNLKHLHLVPEALCLQSKMERLGLKFPIVEALEIVEKNRWHFFVQRVLKKAYLQGYAQNIEAFKPILIDAIVLLRKLHGISYQQAMYAFHVNEIDRQTQQRLLIIVEYAFSVPIS